MLNTFRNLQNKHGRNLNKITIISDSINHMYTNLHIDTVNHLNRTITVVTLYCCHTVQLSHCTVVTLYYFFLPDIDLLPVTVTSGHCYPVSHQTSAQ